MQIIPAIDLRGGKVVRWIRGESDKEIIYGEDPVAFVRQYEDSGAEWLHVVDLEGACSGNPLNLEIVRNIRKKTRLKVEFGGGLRDYETIKKVTEAGIDRFILGTKALDIEFLKRMIAEFGDRVAVSLDCSNGFVKIAGWQEQTRVAVIPLLEEMRLSGLKYIIYTDISRDGMLQGPNLPALKEVLNASGDMQIIQSGGVSSLEDVRAILRILSPNLYGMIIGRALYEEKIKLSEAIELNNKQSL